MIPILLASAGENAQIIGGVSMFVIMAAVVVAAFYIGASLFAVAPAVVVEGLGPWGAIRRSWQLARGGRLRILGTIVICSIIVTLPILALTMSLGVSAVYVDPVGAEEVLASRLVLHNVLSSLVRVLTVPFGVGCVVLLYFDRRVRTEGYDLEATIDSLVHAE